MRLIDRDPNGASVVIAIGNALIVCLVLVSPIGVDNGAGVISNSVFRLAILVVVQVPLMVLGMLFALMSQRRGGRWGAGVFLNAIVGAGTVAFYFAEPQVLGGLQALGLIARGAVAA